MTWRSKVRAWTDTDPERTVTWTDQPNPDSTAASIDIHTATFEDLAGFIGKPVLVRREFNRPDPARQDRASLVLKGHITSASHDSMRQEFGVMFAGVNMITGASASTALCLPGTPDSEPGMPDCWWNITLAQTPDARPEHPHI